MKVLSDLLLYLLAAAFIQNFILTTGFGSSIMLRIVRRPKDILLFSGLLALDAAYPLALFRWQHMCDVKDPEPSDFYLGMQRAGWCIYPILLLIGYNIALWVLP